ncbi:hypothetical protein IMCC3317_14240 [Kordia antarctica]|uniref:Uncharacterized protein n=1 Tax=Kordia antarctica TaxID=1218801 RepID=A0A7L4ZHW4_9FLAO|nr:hypothetical protein IMCC3317_14240 [Kordia antarctica]
MLEKLKQYQIKNSQTICGGSETQRHQIKQETTTK